MVVQWPEDLRVNYAFGVNVHHIGTPRIVEEQNKK